MNEDFLKIASKACLKITAGGNLVAIKHRLRAGNPSTLGVVLFFLGGLFLIMAPFLKTSDTTTKIIGIVFGLLLVVFSILTLIRQIADGLEIKDGMITFRHNLKSKTIVLDGKLNIKIRTEVLKIRRVGTQGTDFIVVTLLLQDQNMETVILKFQMDNAQADSAKKLGNELKRIMQQRNGMADGQPNHL